MSYDFLKDSIKNPFLLGQINEKFFSSFGLPQKDLFILNTNIDACCDLFGFLNNKDQIFILNGFMGAGKSVVLNLLSKCLRDDVLLFKTNYFEATNLDDILLSLFNDFTNYHNDKKIVLSKIDSSIFSDKINAFIKSSNLPMLFVFDSFEIMKASSENQKDLLNFIKYLSNFDKVKIIIASRSFDEDDLPSIEGVKASRIKLLDSEDFNKLLKINKINENSFYEEQIFKYTKGHYLYASFVVNLVELLSISFNNLSAEYSKRNSTFSDFLIFKILGLIPDKFLKLLWFLSLIRHGVSENFVLAQKFASKEDIEYLKNRMIVSYESGLIYLKDYMKFELVKSIEPETKAKIHQYMTDLYDSQLPKKPNERDLLISRATMRQEMEYHKHHVEHSKTVQTQTPPSHAEIVDFNYMTYAKSIGHDWNFKKSPIAPKEPIKQQGKQSEKPAAAEKTKRFELSKEEIMLLNSSNDEDGYEDSFKDIVNTDDSIASLTESPVSIQHKEPESLEDFIKKAQKSEDDFDFKSAIENYQKALSYKDDLLYDVKKPLIMTKLAICYKKIQNTEKAIKQFEEVYSIYAKTEPIKANYILLSIAQIYNETYKFIMAKNIYEKILKSQVDNPKSLVVRALLDLAEIEDHNSNMEKAIEYCQQAILESEHMDDSKLFSEACFKYALLLDDLNKVDLAYKYYLKCTQVTDDPSVNTYLSSAYSNLAAICSEKNDNKKAVEYYELSIEVDKAQNNYEGLYFGYSKLAHISQSESPNKALENLVKALGSARRLDDIFYAASAYLDLGDFYYNRKIDAKALKAYLQARRLILKQPNEENIQKVNTRINDIKARLGNVKFVQLISEFQKR